jgi:hypothetical protein
VKAGQHFLLLITIDISYTLEDMPGLKTGLFNSCMEVHYKLRNKLETVCCISVYSIKSVQGFKEKKVQKRISYYHRQQGSSPNMVSFLFHTMGHSIRTQLRMERGAVYFD